MNFIYLFIGKFLYKLDESPCKFYLSSEDKGKGESREMEMLRNSDKNTIKGILTL